MTVWLLFALCVALIGFAGVQLSISAHVIADKTGVGRTWIGLTLLATVTSLPELATGMSSVALANVPEIAIGDIMGSCVFNLVILVVLDFLQRDRSIYNEASQAHLLSAGFGIVLIGFVGFSLLLTATGATPSLGHVGMYAPVTILLYGVAMRTIFHFELRKNLERPTQQPERFPGTSLRQAVLRYAGAAVVVVAAGSYLPYVAEDIAVLMGWRQGFVGTLFVAFATSLPELVVSVAALRIGALDMAISNLLGSNLFNILIIALDDLLFLPGPILAHVSATHGISALSALMMTGVAIVGLVYRPRGRILGTVGSTSVALLLIYLANTYVLYRFGGG